ncbi:MAG: sulfur carrier protein ThiS adenylyltransferase ThiF [Clostridia bacterium]|nr:sulfur carrier protein ThiS adenylyltransferase ThiF [Clostridia bacterium]
MFSEEEYTEALSQKQGKGMQEKLGRATVAVCGLGGLGSNVSLMLARCGLGTLILTDNNYVGLSDISRQVYLSGDVGEKKTDVIGRIIESAAPFCKTEIHFCDLLSGDTAYLFRADIIVECLDRAESKAAFVNKILETYPNKFLVSATGMGGLKPGNDIRTKKVTERFFMCGDGATSSSEGLYGPRVMICAAHEALKALEIIRDEL